jgi:hypothetical protein
VGFETKTDNAQPLGKPGTYKSGKEAASSPASLSPGNLCPELDRVVKSWPKLRRGARNAILALIAAEEEDSK